MHWKGNMIAWWMIFQVHVIKFRSWCNGNMLHTFLIYNLKFQSLLMEGHIQLDNITNNNAINSLLFENCWSLVYIPQPCLLTLVINSQSRLWMKGKFAPHGANILFPQMPRSNFLLSLEVNTPLWNQIWTIFMYHALS